MIDRVTAAIVGGNFSVRDSSVTDEALFLVRVFYWPNLRRESEKITELLQEETREK